MRARAPIREECRLRLQGDPTGWGRWLARVYARWCLREMAAAARHAVAGGP